MNKRRVEGLKILQNKGGGEGPGFGEFIEVNNNILKICFCHFRVKNRIFDEYTK